MSYKKLGDYIQQVNNRNRDLQVDTLLGVSITKKLIPSIANTVGTDMSTYKIIEKGQFAYGTITSRNGDKISIALADEYDKALVSQIYIVFEVIDKNELLPEYLMMWFSRPEFDRYARYHSHGSTRESFDWEDLCNVELPIPSIEKQREIVAQYQAVENKIKVNEQICEKLEATAQTLYKQWFVNFEFPVADTEVLEVSGVVSSASTTIRGYKSSGGAMVFNEELEKEIPEGWEVKEINRLCSIGSSKRIYESEYVKDGIPFYRGKEITIKKEGKNITDPYFISKDRYNELVKKYGKPSNGDILMTAVGTIGSTYMVENESFYFKDGNVIWFKDFTFEGVNYYLYDFMQSKLFDDLITEITIGSTQSAITITTFGGQKILIPNEEILINYSFISKNMNELIKKYKKQNQKLSQLQSLLLSRLVRLAG
ncbi:MAG: restriction endonuclease subunit S [Myroides sp.]|nr:restriction endonuclease subunit S [Myroides sp.]